MKELNVISIHIMGINILSITIEVALRWIIQDLTDVSADGLVLSVNS